MVGDLLSSAWHNLTAKTDRTAAALVKNDPNPGVSAKTALVSSAYAVADSDPVGSNLYKAGEGFSGGSYFEPSTGKLQLDTPQQAAGHLETAGLSFGLELGTAYLGGELLSGLRAPAAGKIPTLTIDGSKYPDLAENISNAQAAGHPDVLTYGGDINANRAAAMQNVPKISGLSRDEYPFASSMEGGADSWVGHIPVPQQNAQGALLKNFYQANELQSGDQYRVITTNVKN